MSVTRLRFFASDTGERVISNPVRKYKNWVAHTEIENEQLKVHLTCENGSRFSHYVLTGIKDELPNQMSETFQLVVGQVNVW